ncbi:Protein sidekick-2 [Exaiptasia diaphana]|nr:Protein sidekick-2 [Exaiptasia diaphana]
MYDGNAKSCSGLGTDLELSHDVQIDLGNGKPLSDGQGNSSFRGQISSVYVWNEILTLSNMWSMFTRCQPRHQIKPMVSWKKFLENTTQKSNITVTRPSQCHAKENLAFNCSAFPTILVDGKLDDAVNGTPSLVHVHLHRKALITEVLVSVGNVSNQAKLYLYLGSVPGSVPDDSVPVSSACQSPKEITPFQSVVFYCKNNTYFENNVTVEAWFDSEQGSIDYREVVVFGQSYHVLPVAVLPLSSKLPDTIEFGTKDFELSSKHDVKDGLGPTFNEFSGSYRFFRRPFKSSLVFDIKKTSSLLKAKSITISCWFSLDVLPDETAQLFSFRGRQPDDKTLQMVMDKDKLIARFGSGSESPSSGSVTRNTKLDKFAIGVWYHVAMTYHDETLESEIILNGMDKLAKGTKKIYLVLTNEFVIGQSFPGRIACMHIFQDWFYTRYMQEVMYSCYNYEPVPPRPAVFFPFRKSDTYKNAMDMSMATQLTGLEVTDYADRVGILNESYGGMTFFKKGCLSCNYPLAKLELNPYYEFKPKICITITMWLRAKNQLQKCQLYDQGSTLRLSIDENIFEAKFAFFTEWTSNDVSHVSLQVKEQLDKWHFVLFSFDSNLKIAQLEIDGTIRNRKKLQGKLLKLHDLKSNIKIGNDCQTQLACLQVYNTVLTKQQKTLAKYSCVFDREGIFKTPQKLQFSQTGASSGIINWTKPGFPIGGLLQGYRVNVTNLKSGQVKTYITEFCKGTLEVDQFEQETNYTANAQPIGRIDGSPSQTLNFTIPLGPIEPPAEIVASSLGSSSILVTWTKSISRVLGYTAIIHPKSIATNTTVNMVCSNVTSVEFVNLTALTQYVVNVIGFDARRVGEYPKVPAVVSTDEEAPRNAPTRVRVFNVRVGETHMYVGWDFKPDPNLKGKIQGYKIRVWLTGVQNVTQAKMYEKNVQNMKIYLNVDKNFTFVVYAVTGSGVLGPGSVPTTNRDEIAALKPPKLRSIYTSWEDCGIHLSWDKPDIFPLSGISRLFRVTYYVKREGHNVTKQENTTFQNIRLSGLKPSETYLICVAAQTVPGTPFGPCSNWVDKRTHCRIATPVPTKPPPPLTSRMPSTTTTTTPRTTTTTATQITTNTTSTTCPTSPTNESYSSTVNVPTSPTTLYDISVDAKLIEEKWNDNLANQSSPEFKRLESRLCANSYLLYSAVLCYIEKCWKGSVMTTLHIKFAALAVENVIAFQESLDINKTLGNTSLLVEKVHSQTLPSKGPNITSIKAVTATVAQLSWQPTNQYPDSFQGYIISYRPLSVFTWLTATCGTGCTSIVVDKLLSNTTYRFRVQILTDKARGIAGDAVLLVMPPSVSKDVSPPNVITTVLSSTSIVVEWDPLPDGVISGKFLGYRVLCEEADSGKVIEKTLNSWVQVAIFKSLNKYKWYSIRVFGFSDLGSGVPSPLIRLQTLEDVPSAPPSNVIVEDMFSTTSLKMRWNPVPHDQRNGIIKGYKITYKMAADDDYDESNTKMLQLPPDSTSITIGSLASSASYDIEILAYTSIGNGVSTKISAATCKCNANIYSNYLPYPPYVSIKPTGGLDGIFGAIVEDMVLTACGVCTNGHGKSKLHITNNGKGSHSLKETHSEVLDDIDDVTDVSFPIYGYVGDTEYMKYYKYVSVVESPGVAFLAVRPQVFTVANNTVYNVVSNSWMLLIFLLLLMYVFGVVFWIAESRSNSEQFPTDFRRGVLEGLWFSFVSMTTVGYGDRTPVTILAKLVTIIWTVVGLVMLSIFMGVVTSSITVVTTEIKQEVQLYGANVSAVENSVEYKAGILKNAKMVGYPSLKETYNSLSNRHIQGVLVDAYVAGSPENIVNQPKDTYVNRLLAKSNSYGIVLSGKVTRIAPACREYIKQNQAKISQLVSQFVKSLKDVESVNVNQTDDEIPAVVYQSTPKINIMIVIEFLAVIYAGFVGLGIVWECFFRYSKNRNICKLKPHPDNIKEMKESVDNFYCRFKRISSELREKHQQQIKALKKSTLALGKVYDLNSSRC